MLAIHPILLVVDLEPRPQRQQRHRLIARDPAAEAANRSDFAGTDLLELGAHADAVDLASGERAGDPAELLPTRPGRLRSRLRGHRR
jgi:hypothetical protein